MPDDGVEWLRQEDILSYEEITEIVREGVKLGIKRVRLTGGEPLVRKGIITLVKMLLGIEELNEVTMTTNGILLSEYANELVCSGLKRINISLDTLDPQKYSDLTRGGNLTDVLEGIRAIKEAGLQEIKLNCVIMNSTDEPDAKAIKAFAVSERLKVQFIHQMNLETGQFSLVEGGNGGNCKSCNRLRLTSNGFLKPCLFNSSGFNIREFGIREAFRLALENKPKSGTRNQSGHFYNIGG
jgi:cyclic pyranopterin phosphate synthase